MALDGLPRPPQATKFYLTYSHLNPFTIRFAGGLILWIVTCFSVQAQIEITFPSTRAVFQRNNANETTLYVAGHYTDCLDRVEARLIPRAAGQGEAVDWTVVQANPSGGLFYGMLTVRGGWYNLEVRGIENNSVIASATVERVGVGEVFVVAGQSNATGGGDLPNGPSASDDRVNTVNFQNIDPTSGVIAEYEDVTLPCPVFVHLDDITKPAPFGNYAWNWGAFGDQLVGRLNVPVMIFQAGWSGTSLYNWQESIDPQGTTVSPYGINYPKGLPYGHLRLALNYYIAQQGYRAVLWHQGENDSFFENSRETYRNGLRSLIQASRSLSNKPDLAWVVARVSRMTKDGVSRIWQPVIDAQNDVIGLNGNDPSLYLPHVYAGPETDPLEGPAYRTSDNIHFTGNGLLLLAEAWSNALSNSFFTASNPYLPTAPPQVTASCAGNNSLNFQAPGGWATYEWLPVTNCNQTLHAGQNWTATTGNYLLKVKDTHQNTVLSPTLVVPASTATEVTISGSSTIPPGSTLTLGAISDGACSYAWTGPAGFASNEAEVSIPNADSSRSGTYQVNVSNLYGCQAQASQNVQVGSEVQSVSSGNWNSPTSWSCGCVPSPAMEVVIREGHTITLDGASVQIKSIRLQGGVIQLENNAQVNLAH